MKLLLPSPLRAVLLCFLFAASSAIAGTNADSMDGILTLGGTNKATADYQNSSYEYSNHPESLTGDIDFQSYESVLFDENELTSSSSSACGGAISASALTFVKNGDITFSKNTASSTAYYAPSHAFGGAIYANSNSSTLTFTENNKITFGENVASCSYSSAYGGAIYVGYQSALTFTDNVDILFSGNTASSSSTASAKGGAIYAYSGSMLTIQGSALFEKNTEITSGTYRLRSIFQYGASLELSAPTDKIIELRDSIYSEVSTAIFNRDYEKSDGSTQAADGTIRITGKYTAEHLAEMKGSAGTADELTNSLTSTITGTVQLMSGTLSVEDGAILNIGGLTTGEQSATLRVQDATLMTSSNITLGEGSTLDMSGQSTLTGTMVSCDIFLASVDVSSLQENTPLLRICGALTANYLELDLNGALPTEDGIYLLMEAGIGEDFESMAENVTYAGTIDSSILTWEKGGLVYYNGKQSNGSYDYSSKESPLANPDSWYFYKSGITFKENSAEAINATTGMLSFGCNGDVSFSRNTGSAIHASGSLMTFTGNGDIAFSGNTASSSDSAYGGAIYANSHSSLVLTDNGNISFSDNVSSGSSWGYGGAIYANDYCALTFTRNGNIIFSGNTASCSSTASAIGGAIYANSYSPLTFTDNGNIFFVDNTVSGSACGAGGAIYASAIYASSHSPLTFTGNGDITFVGNTARAAASYDYSSASGGAIAADILIFNGNGKITFSKNTASATDGAYIAYGGAIDTCLTLTFTDNDDILFSENTARSSSPRAKGGAINACNSSTLTIQGSALFAKNIEISSGGYRLRSIYQDSGSMELSAPTAKSIEFRDSIYSKATTVSLNKDYTKSDGSTQAADGTIRITGATAEADLQAMKGSAGTEEEVTKSRTSEFTGAVTLYGGNLIIEEKAVLNITGSLTVEDGNVSVATGAQLNLEKSDLTMPSLTLDGGTVMLGSEDDHDATLTLTTLTVTADSVLNANLSMTSGTISFAKDATAMLGCSVTLGDGVVITLADDVVYGLQDGTITNLTLFESADEVSIGDVIIQNTKGEAMESGWVLQTDSNGNIFVTPEPATATLSLLALAGLCARRRR